MDYDVIYIPGGLPSSGEVRADPDLIVKKFKN